MINLQNLKQQAAFSKLFLDKKGSHSSVGISKKPNNGMSILSAGIGDNFADFYLDSQIDIGNQKIDDGFDFLELVKNINNESVLEIKQKSDNVSVFAGGLEQSFTTSEFVDRKETLEEKTLLFKTTAFELLSIIEKTESASAREDIRYYLNGVLWRSNSEEGFVVCSTNGSQMSLIRQEKKDIDFNFILQIKTIEILQKILKKTKNKDQEIVFYKTTNRTEFVVIKTDSYSIYTKVVDGNFPDYRRIIKDSYTKKISVNKEQFLNVLKQIKPVKSKGSLGDIVRVNINENNIVLSYEFAEKKQKIEIKTEKNEHQISFGMNIKYIMSAVACIDSPIININFTDNNSQFQFFGEEISHVFIIMPARV